jgi:hypothetical protein
VQLLTELADFNIDPSVFSAGSIPEYKSQDTAALNFTGTTIPTLNSVSDGHEAPNLIPTTQLRLKLALDAGIVNNVVLGSEDRLEYCLSGAIIDKISELIGSVGP